MDNGANAAFAIIDGAACAGLLELLEGKDWNYSCLYRGELDVELKKAAPYLVDLRHEGGFDQALIEKTWGRSCAIFIIATVATEMDALRHHLRTLNQVKDPKGRDLLFRYYDPRVLRVFLPTSDKDQCSAFFGQRVQSFICEEAGGNTAIRFDYTDQSFTSTKVAIEF